MRIRPVLSLVWILVFCSLVIGQRTAVTLEKGGRFEPRPEVVELALPVFPAAAGGLGGIVTVRVVIDENGNISVDRVSGPPPVCPAVTDPKVVALRQAAAEAARNAKFKPALLDGQPVRSTVWLNYDFQVPVKDSKSDGEPLQYAATNVNGGVSLISGGVLNGKAVLLPKPAYPPAARAVRAAGAVSVKVLIDEEGNMYSAEAVSGHPLLRAASRQAACDAKFSPTQLEGKPVKVTGVITYIFVP